MVAFYSAACLAQPFAQPFAILRAAQRDAIAEIGTRSPGSSWRNSDRYFVASFARPSMAALAAAMRMAGITMGLRCSAFSAHTSASSSRSVYVVGNATPFCIEKVSVSIGLLRMARCR